MSVQFKYSLFIVLVLMLSTKQEAEHRKEKQQDNDAVLVQFHHLTCSSNKGLGKVASLSKCINHISLL